MKSDAVSSMDVRQLAMVGTIQGEFMKKTWILRMPQVLSTWKFPPPNRRYNARFFYQGAYDFFLLLDSGKLVVVSGQKDSRPARLLLGKQKPQSRMHDLLTATTLQATKLDVVLSPMTPLLRITKHWKTAEISHRAPIGRSSRTRL